MDSPHSSPLSTPVRVRDPRVRPPAVSTPARRSRSSRPEPPREVGRGDGDRGSIDILFITYNRPHYTRRSLPRLLETCDETMRVWLWHNGDHPETLEVVRSYADHPRVRCFYHSRENKSWGEPTIWFFNESDADYLSKVDDDCLVPDGWARTLRRAHEDVPEFGILGCWRFQPEDFDEALARPKIQTFNGHTVLRNFWIEQSGYLMKRACVDELGPPRSNESFDGRYGIRLALAGWVHGWYMPFLRQVHMDDPRSPHTALRSDEDIEEHLPLSAKMNGVRTVAEWDAQLRRSARLLQSASIDPRDYRGWRLATRKVRTRLRRLAGVSRLW